MELARIRQIDTAPQRRRKAGQGPLQLAQYAEALRSCLPELERSERERIEVWCRWRDDRPRRSDPVEATSLIVGINDERNTRSWQSWFGRDEPLAGGA